MALKDIDRQSVLAAVAEHDELGRDAFLARYGFRPSRKFVLVVDGRFYDSKAMVGVANRYVEGNALPASTFSGGEQTVVALLARLGFDVRRVSALPETDPKGWIGELPGVPSGTSFANRAEAMEARVHRNNTMGIVGRAATGAESIVVSGGYEDDEDLGSTIIYTGQGGQAGKRQVADQSFDVPQNAALLTSMLTGAPVRVLRGAHKGSPHAPATGVRYDGLYRVVDAWSERGLSGFVMCRYRLVAIEELPEGDAEHLLESSPEGNEMPGRKLVSGERLVRSVRVAEYIKLLYDHTCQACGIRLVAGHGRPYAEAAHVRGLGRPHSGPDVPANVLCLCPNCHVLFDTGAMTVDEDLLVWVNDVPRGRLRVHEDHLLERAQLAYHRSLQP